MAQKKITQSDYIDDEKMFDPFIRETNFLLRNDEYIVIHLDGVHFTSKYYRDFNLNEKKAVFSCFVKATKELCGYLKSSRIAYVCGDEV